MGVDRSIVAQAIRGVISVRLVRKICDSCKVEMTPSEEQLKLLPHELLGSKFYHGTGCEVCKNLGYIGRTGIFEIVDVDSEIRGSIFDAPPSSVVLDLLKKKNAKNLRVAAFNKVKDGVTTIDEALRVTGYLAD